MISENIKPTYAIVLTAMLLLLTVLLMRYQAKREVAIAHKYEQLQKQRELKQEKAWSLQLSKAQEKCIEDSKKMYSEQLASYTAQQRLEDENQREKRAQQARVAFEIAKEEAKQGQITAQMTLSELYLRGEGTDVHFPLAVYWLNEAWLNHKFKNLSVNEPQICSDQQSLFFFSLLLTNCHNDICDSQALHSKLAGRSSYYLDRIFDLAKDSSLILFNRKKMTLKWAQKRDKLTGTSAQLSYMVKDPSNTLTFMIGMESRAESKSKLEIARERSLAVNHFISTHMSARGEAIRAHSVHSVYVPPQSSLNDTQRARRDFMLNDHDRSFIKRHGRLAVDVYHQSVAIVNFPCLLQVCRYMRDQMNLQCPSQGGGSGSLPMLCEAYLCSGAR